MSRSLAYAMLLLGTFFWGVSFVVIKQGTLSYPPALFLAWRYLLASAVLAMLFARRLPGLGRAGLLAGTWLGLVLYVGTMTQTIGLGSTTASNAGFIAGTALIFVPFFKYLLDRTRLTGAVLGSCVLALAGLAALSLDWPIRLRPGDLWVLTSAAAYGLQIVLAGRYVHRHDPMALTLVQLFCCCLCCLLQALVAGQPLTLPATAAVWQAIGFTALLATAFTYGAQNLAQQTVEEHKVALIFLTEPIFASLAGYLYLGEALTWRLALGGGLILSAILLAEFSFQRRPAVSGAEAGP